MNIPERFDNTRAGNIKWLGVALLLSIVMLLTNHFGWTSFASYTVAGPVLAIYARLWLYGLLVNAFHEAIRLSDHDSVIDQMEGEEAASEASRTLGPDAFKSAFGA